MFVDEKAAGEMQTAEQANRKLKLSEAMRIGAKIRPKCTGRAFSNGGSCAMGAAWEGLKGSPWPEDQYIEFPNYELEEAFGFTSQLRNQVWARNDGGWTREAIADWLESQGY